MTGDVIGYQIWFSRDDGVTRCVVNRLDAEGQLALVDTDDFGPLCRTDDLVAWLWAKMKLDLTGRL